MGRKALEIEGLRPGISIREYITMDACGGSDLENMRRSAAYCKMMQDREDEPSEARDFGTATHTALLEPDMLESTVGFLPEGFTARSKDNKAHLAAMRGKYTVVLKHERRAMLEAMVRGAQSNDAARSLLYELPGSAEMTGTVSDPETGALVKIRPDRLIPSIGTVVELKTTRAESEFEFEKQVWNLGYHRKASFVMAVLGWMADKGLIEARYDTFAFLGMANTPPHEVCVKAISVSVLEREMAEWRPLLDTYAECKETNEWHGWDDTVSMLAPPAWMKDRYLG